LPSLLKSGSERDAAAAAHLKRAAKLAAPPEGQPRERLWRTPIPMPERRRLRVKRSADVALAMLGLVALAPLMALIALAIKLDSRGTVLYWNERIGQGGRRFRLCKFRTMHLHACRGERYGADAAEELFREIMSDAARREEFERTHKLRDDPRVTRLGALLRRTSLDELPQLANVLVGQLSVVGPRPVMAYEVRKLEAMAHGALERAGKDGSSETLPSLPRGYWETAWLKPGVTGYWQVTARSSVGYEERMRMDLLYTQSWSLRLDLLIVLRTLGALRGRDAY
jgi:lipopolysaccharide/colanic/teichoic acid biosynthesis glycosyltransferase